MLRILNSNNFALNCKGITLYDVPLPYPMNSSNQIIEMYTDLLKKHHNVKLVILGA